jgi:hypothetical protein
LAKPDCCELVAALIDQLLSQCVNIPNAVQEVFRKEGVHVRRELPLKTLVELLTCLLDNFDQVHLLIDAIDEFADPSKLITLIQRMHELKRLHLHILLTSQSHPIPIADYMKQLSPNQLIDMEKSAGDTDIRLHIQKSLESTPELRQRWANNPGHVLHRIEDTLVKKADSS